MPSWLPDNSIESAHVGRMDFRNLHGAVGLLVVLKDRQPGAAHGQAAAVDGVDKLGLGLGAPFPAGPGSGCWRGAPGRRRSWSRRRFRGKVLAGQPDFEVVGLGGGEAGVAGAEQNAAIRQVEGFEDLFGVAGERSCSASDSSGRVNLTSSTF
jgi:hypothetical protein